MRAGGRLLEKSAFGGTKPLLLLKAIISRGARDIPKEILIDTLWPDAGPGAGDKNLKVNLHRLRKALEPDHIKGLDYNYLGQKSGRISLNSDLVFLDTDKFIDLAAEGRAKEASDKGEEALDCYCRAARIYMGDYFAEDPYLEWLARPRDGYRAEYIEILDRKARLHEDFGQWQEAVDSWRLILRADPCFEAAFRNLMILYTDSGRTDEAIKVFNECCTVLKKELGASPHASTYGVYQRIQNL